MHALRRILTHDWPVIVLVAINLAGISLYLGAGPAWQAGAGYRVIDIKAVQRMLDSGDLSRHEAEWYQSNTTSGKEINKQLR
jgi:hypothetical protein